MRGCVLRPGRSMRGCVRTAPGPPPGGARGPGPGHRAASESLCQCQAGPGIICQCCLGPLRARRSPGRRTATASEGGPGVTVTVHISAHGPQRVSAAAVQK